MTRFRFWILSPRDVCNYEIDRTWSNSWWSLPFCSIFQNMICVWSSFVFPHLDIIESRKPSGRQQLLSFDKGTTWCFKFSGSLSSYRIQLYNLTGCVTGITCGDWIAPFFISQFAGLRQIQLLRFVPKRLRVDDSVFFVIWLGPHATVDCTECNHQLSESANSLI